MKAVFNRPREKWTSSGVKTKPKWAKPGRTYYVREAKEASRKKAPLEVNNNNTSKSPKDASHLSSRWAKVHHLDHHQRARVMGEEQLMEGWDLLPRFEVRFVVVVSIFEVLFLICNRRRRLDATLQSYWHGDRSAENHTTLFSIIHTNNDSSRFFFACGIGARRAIIASVIFLVRKMCINFLYLLPFFF